MFTNLSKFICVTLYAIRFNLHSASIWNEKKRERTYTFILFFIAITNYIMVHHPPLVVALCRRSSRCYCKEVVQGLEAESLEYLGLLVIVKVFEPLCHEILLKVYRCAYQWSVLFVVLQGG